MIIFKQCAFRRRVSSLGNPVVSVLASRCYSNFSNNDDETMKSGESKLDKSDRNSKNGEVVDKLNKLLMQMAEVPCSICNMKLLKLH